jgi:hypothetical protein
VEIMQMKNGKCNDGKPGCECPNNDCFMLWV